MISSLSQGGPNIALITMVCGWVFLGVELIAVSLYVWSQRIRKLSLASEDHFLIIGFVTGIGLTVQTTWAIVDEGMDKHESEIPKTFGRVVKSLLVNETLWGLVNTCIRINAILLIKRIFGPHCTTRIIASALLILSILYGLVVLLEFFLICRPMALNWESDAVGTCGDQIVSYLILETLGLLIDFAILVTPWFAIWRINVSRRTKLGIIIIFSVGILVFVVTGLRIQALRMVIAEDFTYSKGYLGLLSAIGASLGTTSCCAPGIPAVWRHVTSGRSDRASIRAIYRTDEEQLVSPSQAVARPFRPHTILLLEYNTPPNHLWNERWSMDCTAPEKLPPYAGIRRHPTF